LTDTAPSSLDRFRGCLLLGAIGDALGAGVEFLSLAEIRARFGPDGVTGYVPAYGRLGAITDDSQMTLFTAEGLIRAQQRLRDRGLANVPATVWRAYLRWLLTQVRDPDRVPRDPEFPRRVDGWLIEQEFLHHRRAPGNTCMSAMLGGRMGSVDAPLNDSTGCGGVMRVAPVGLIASDPFRLGCDIAALTHGHPSGYLSAGALALMISEAVHGATVAEAVDRGIVRLEREPGSAEVIDALRAAVEASGSPPTPQSIEALGAGWTGDEALAIAVHCALAAPDVRSAFLAAVNHGGDSDSTGAICGNLLGAAHGVDAGTGDLLAGLEGMDVILELTEDLHAAFVEGRDMPFDRYPTW
jgi:ADP-ribosylglycohydrolase